MGSRPRLDTGLLGIVSVQIGRRRRGGEARSPSRRSGQVRAFPGWLEWEAAEFEVGSGSNIATGIDGEGIVLEPPLRFRIAPAALAVRLPPHAPGVSPAAVSPGLTAAGLRQLWTIAAGRPPSSG